MKIEGTKPRAVSGVAPLRPRQTRAGAARPEAAAPVKQDSISIMGIPEPELTPKVREALMALMAEVESMRRERLADRDPLIPVANRRAFVRELTRTMAYSERYGHASSVVYIDLNDFKDINDTYGHTAGDEALKHVADILLKNVRESDVVGRLGGDEFGVILEKSDADAAREKAEALREAILASPMQWQDAQITVNVAFGVYTFSGPEDAGHALAAADRDMYAHKRSTKGE